MDLKTSFYKAVFSPHDLGDKLVLAIDNHDEERVHTLIKAGAQLDHVAYGNATPLTAAIWRGDENLVSDLLKAGANPNFCDGQTRSPLNCAITSYQLRKPEGNEGFATPDILRSLLTAGADVNALDEYGMKTMRERIRMESTNVLEALFQEWETKNHPVQTADSIVPSTVEKDEAIKVRRPLKLIKKA